MREKFAGSQADRAESVAAAVAKKAAAAKKGGAPPASSVAGKLDDKAAGVKAEQKNKQQPTVKTQNSSPTEVRYQLLYINNDVWWNCGPVHKPDILGILPCAISCSSNKTR